ncbi:MAG: hypothetical protein II225_00250, partial [Ruminococcus sp.]|nr:hypothetical protein [Ruminococcus sp.]
MKDYNEMAKAVFERRDEFVANRKKQRATLLKAGVPVCALALVCVLGVTLRFDKLPEIPQLPPYSVTETTDENGLTNSTQEITTPENPGNTQNNSDPTQSGEAENRPQITTSANQNSTRPTENNGVNNDSTDTDDTRPVTPPAQDPTEPSEELPTQPPSRPGPETTAPPPPSEPNGSEESEPSISEPDFTEPEEPDPWEPDFTEPEESDPWEPDFTEPEVTEPWEPEATAPVCSDPSSTGGWFPNDTEPSENMTDPTEPNVTEPETVVPTEEPTEPRSTGPLEVTLGDKTYTVQTGDMITYTAELYVAEVLNKIEYSLNYGDELKPVDLRDYSFTSEQRMKAYMPNLDVPYAKLSFDIADVYNKGNRKIVMSDFGFREPKDFTQKKILVTFSFIAQYAGSTEIDLEITQMNSDNEAYFTSWGEQLIFEGISIDEYVEVTPAAEIVYPVAPELPYEVFEDDTPFTYPEESEEGELHINCDGRTYSANVGDTFTYVVEMKVYELFEDIQLKLNFDNSLVEMVKPTRGKPTSMSEAFPNVEGIYVGCHPKILRMNAVYLDGIDFRKRKVLMTVEFTVLKGGNLNL